MPAASTNLTDGMDMAAGQFRNLREVSSYDYENRIIVLTDAEPNTGDFSLSGISSRMQTNAASRIYTTFIGIGVDFNSQLVEAITKVKGANYYSVHSPAEFRQRMNDEFDYHGHSPGFQSSGLTSSPTAGGSIRFSAALKPISQPGT